MRYMTMTSKAIFERGVLESLLDKASVAQRALIWQGWTIHSISC